MKLNLVSMLLVSYDSLKACLQYNVMTDAMKYDAKTQTAKNSDSIQVLLFSLEIN